MGGFGFYTLEINRDSRSKPNDCPTISQTLTRHVQYLGNLSIFEGDGQSIMRKLREGSGKVRIDSKGILYVARENGKSMKPSVPRHCGPMTSHVKPLSSQLRTLDALK